MSLVFVGHLAGRVGWGLGWGPPITKIKGFYKKCYKLVSKENPRGAEEGSEEGKGKNEVRSGNPRWKKLGR